LAEFALYLLGKTAGVAGFVGSSGEGAKLHALWPEEVEAILKRMRVQEKVVQGVFSVNETVRVMEGLFADFTGDVEHIDLDKQKVKVHVSMFGRETPVELDFSQVEKL